MIESKPTHIKGMDLEELESVVSSQGHKKFRGLQIYKWIYKNKESEVSRMSNIPAELKQFLTHQILTTLSLENLQTSANKLTKKFAFKTSDGKILESVSMIDGNRHTVCISSQIGCSVNCSFCATAKMGIIRNLEIGEIIQQLIIISKEREQPITNVVFMGMGEPFLNYKNVIKSSQIMNDSKGFNLSSKKITISTSGILPKIKKFIDDKIKY